MSHIPPDAAQDLEHDFPGQAQQIREMRAYDAHFAQLLAQYLQLKRQLHPPRGQSSRLPAEGQAQTHATLLQHLNHMKEHIAYHLQHGPEH